MAATIDRCDDLRNRDAPTASVARPSATQWAFVVSVAAVAGALALKGGHTLSGLWNDPVVARTFIGTSHAPVVLGALLVLAAAIRRSLRWGQRALWFAVLAPSPGALYGGYKAARLLLLFARGADLESAMLLSPVYGGLLAPLISVALLLLPALWMRGRPRESEL